VKNIIHETLVRGNSELVSFSQHQFVAIATLLSQSYHALKLSSFKCDSFSIISETKAISQRYQNFYSSPAIFWSGSGYSAVPL